MFGQQNKSTASSQQQTGRFGSFTNGQQDKTGSNFSTLKLQTGPFGQQQARAQPQGFSPVQSNSSASVVGQSSIGSHGTAQTGTVIKFTPITGTDTTVQKSGITTSINTKHCCITCMKEYEGKSLEELRYEDYLANRKCPHQQTGFKATPFGTATSSTPSLFRQADDKPAFGQTTAFGQTRSTFGQPVSGFGHPNHQNTDLFGKSTTGFRTFASGAGTSSFGTNTNLATSFTATHQSKPQQSQAKSQGSSLLKFNSSASVVEQPSTIDRPGTAQTGTVIKFTSITGTDVVQKGHLTTWINTKYHCITCMKEYEGKSLEELRYEDYLANRKGPHQQTGFKATPFGTTPYSAPSLFRQADNKPAFGQTTSFGQTQSAFGQSVTAFDHKNQQNTGSFGNPTTGFGTLPSFGTNSNVASSFGVAQQSKPQQSRAQPQESSLCQSTSSASIFGQSSTFASHDIAQSGTTIKFTPIVAIDTIQKGAVSTLINTKHHCITFMKEYEGKSLEELRYEDYLAGRKNLVWKSQVGFGTTYYRKKKIATSLKQRQYSRGPSAKGSNQQNNDRNCFSVPFSPLTSLSGKSSLGQSVIGADFQDKKNSVSFSNRPFSANFAFNNQPRNGNSCSVVSPFGQTFSSFGLCGISSDRQNQQNVDSNSPTPFSEQKQSSTCHNQRNNGDNLRRALPSSYLFDTCDEKVDFVQAQSPRGESGSNSKLHAQRSKDDSRQNVDSDSPTTPFFKQKRSDGNSSRALPSSYLFDNNSCNPPPSLAASLFKNSSDKTIFEQMQPSGKISTDPDLQNEQKICDSSSAPVPSTSHSLTNSEDNWVVGQTKVFEKVQSSSEQSSLPVPSVPLLFDSSKGESVFGHTKEPGETKPPFEKSSMSFVVQNECNSDNDSCTITESSVSPLLGCTNNESLSQQTQFSSDLPVDSNKKQETTDTSSSESSLCDQKDDKIVSDETVGSDRMQSILERFLKGYRESKLSSGKSSTSLVVQNEHNSGNDSCTITESSVSPFLGCTNDESLLRQTQFSSDLPVDSNPKKQETTDTSSSESSLCDQKEDKIVSDETVGSGRMQSLLERFLKEYRESKLSSGKSSTSLVVQNERISGNDSCTVPESSVSPLFGCTNDESLSETQFSSDLPVDSNAKKQETTDTSSSKSSLCDQKEDKIVSDETVGSEQMQSLLERFRVSLSLQNR